MWLRVPFTFCPSAPEAGDSISAWNWRCPLLASSVALRGKPTAERSWTRAWKNKPWLMRLSGRICEPSTAARGVARFIASLPDIPASLSALRASDLALTIPGISGRTCGASLAKWDRNTCSWKTSQATLFSDSTQCLAHLPKTGLMRCGQLYGLPTWAPAISAFAYSVWPTANAGDGTRGIQTPDGKRGLLLHTVTRQWQTPVLGGHRRRGGKRSGELLLPGQAKAFWQTPKTPTGGPELRDSKAARGSGGVDLETESRNWPTAGANDWKGSAKTGQRRGQLDEAAESLCPRSLPDLTSSSDGPRFCGPEELDSTRSRRLLMLQWMLDWSRQNSAALCEVLRRVETGGNVAAPQGRLPRRLLLLCARRRLNPRFVEWLMGWPLGWTDCGCSATGWSRLKRLWRSLISGMF